VGSAPDTDDESNVADDDGVFTEAWPTPRHSQDDDDDDDGVLRGTGVVEQQHGTRTSRDGV